MVEEGQHSVGAQLHKNQTVSSRLLLAFAPIHRRALGLACGLVLGGLLSIATLVLVPRRHDRDFSLDLLGQFFKGYSVSWQGVFVGFLWGMAVGFIFGWSLALIRNAAVWIWLTVIRSRAEMSEYSDLLDHL
jgi:uncharacterized membrane protein YedE/YeeE